MKKVIGLFMTLFLLFGSLSVSAAGAPTFSDTQGHWGEAYIKTIAEKGIISGYPDGTFKPDKNVTRAELAKIIADAFDLSEENTLEEFTDISSAQWYYPYLQKSAKYIPNYMPPLIYPNTIPYRDATAQQFLPDNDTLRIHCAEALVRIMTEVKHVELETPSAFEMCDDVNTWFNDGYELFVMHYGQPATNAVRVVQYTWMAKQLGIMKGEPDGYFYPYQHITRAELAAIICRMLEQ